MQRSVFLFALALFMVVCAGFTAWSVSTDRARTVAREISRVEATARLLAEHSARALEASDALLKRMQDMTAQWELNDTETGNGIRARIVDHIGTSGPVGSAWILDGQGEILLENWSYPPKIKGKYAHRDYFHHHLEPGSDLFISETATGTATNRARFTVSRAVRRGDGSLKAVVVAGIFASHWTAIFDEITPGPVIAALMRSDGATMVAGPGADHAVLAAVNTAVASDRIATVGYLEGHIVATAPIHNYPAVIVLAVPIKQSLAPWRARAVSITAAGLIVSVIFLGVIFVGLAAVRREESHKRELEARVAARTKELARALEAARCANQAKDMFLSTVSHDLRQPLQAMSLLAAVVAGSAHDDKTRKLADQIAVSLTYGQRLLNDLVDLAQLEAGVVRVEPGDVALKDLFEVLRGETLEVAQAAGIRLRVVAPSLSVFSDSDRLRQIIQNLVSNAVKNTPEGGTVLLGCRRCGDEARIEVWDTGSGIPADKIDAVFEQFYQIGNSARNSAQGVGLGLAIVRRTAELLNHRIGVRSQPGKGSVFSVSARLAEHPAPVPKSLAPAAP